MSPEDEQEIIVQFTSALTGRFGTLKPSQAVRRCSALIASLREDHLQWAEIERLFNKALTAQDQSALAKGSIARLFHIANGRANGGTGQAASAKKATFDAAANVGRSGADILPTAGQSETPAEASRPPAPAPDAITGGEPSSNHLERIEERLRAKQRMDEA